MKSIVSDFIIFLKDRFNLQQNQEREDKIIEEIRKGVEFSGINVWVLVFAIMIASIGLNFNSAAVIIGAMLISPLMGPIMGIGLGAGISDLKLINKAATNLAVMVFISVFTSWLYFFISPLNSAQSELLARTTPTIWDVFIGLFGGLAGIIATASREKGNVIPGVAIATALMPPLCTAGYGLAIGNMSYFFGAFYLFSINAVFICFSTLLIVRFLRFREVTFLSPETKSKAKTAVVVFVLAMIIPSIFIANKLVRKSIYLNKVERFITQEISFPKSEVLRYVCEIETDNKQIIVSLIGDPIDESMITYLEGQMENYGLENVALVIKQGSKSLTPDELKSQVLEEYLNRSLDSLQSKEDQINFLKKQLVSYQQFELPMERISKEAVHFDETIQELSIQKAIYFSSKGQPVDTVHLALTKFSQVPKQEKINQLQGWLKTRIESDSVRVIVDQ